MLQPFPTTFAEEIVRLRDIDIFVRHGGDPVGTLALLLHGFTQTSDMWSEFAHQLIEHGYYVVAPDLRGMGRSSKLAKSHTKSLAAADCREVIAALKLQGRKITVIGHDLGAMVAYAFAHQNRLQTNRIVMMEATVPGIGIWKDLLQRIDLTWHFGFHGPTAERLIEGRERIYLDRFWDDFSENSDAISDVMREHYTAFLRQPGAVASTLAHFAAFPVDAEENREFAATRLAAPILGVGGEYSLGAALGEHVALLSEDSYAAVIPGVGHWLIEENFHLTSREIFKFLNANK
ncbi:MAG: alpha/beta hydrolase [Pseudomonadota bacterium]